MRATVVAVAAAEEGLHALRGGPGGVDGGELDALADLLAEPRRQSFDGLLHGVGTVDPLGGGGGELLGLLARGQRRPQLEPARLVAHLADRPVDLAVDDVVDVAAPPFVGDQRLVVDVGEAGLEAPAGQRLDGRAEAVLVAGLAGLVLGARHGGGGARGRHLREQQCSSGEAGNSGPKAVEGCAHGVARLRLDAPRAAAADMGIAAPKCSSATKACK